MTTIGRPLPGAELAARILDATADRAADLAARTGRRPCLATVLVGDDPASVTYVAMKQRRATRVGIDTRSVHRPAGTTTAELVAVLTDLSADPTVDGILLQHPVPPPADERTAFEAISPAKDVDGVTTASFGALAVGGPGAGGGPRFVPCTPGGIVRLLDAHGIDLSGRHAVVIGRSPILGRPVAMLLLGRDATVTCCHSRTRGLPDLVRAGDLVVAAVGRPRFVRGDWLRPGAVVVDAGWHPGDGRHAGGVGDVDHDEAATVAGALTPVPGGVGPVTIAVLLEQTVTAADQAAVDQPSAGGGHPV